jgi:sigma-B regulation protein RsbU (phosphoserine phosphatase)
MQDVGLPASAVVATSRERRRQRAVDSLALSREPNPRLDRITRLGAAVFDVPITSITVVDHGQAWFPSLWGDDDVGRVLRDSTLCNVTMDTGQILVIEDLAADPRLRDIEPVRAAGIRFYAGHPLLDSGGNVVATYCLYDVERRSLTEHQLTIFRDMAGWAQEELVSSAGMTEAGYVQASMFPSESLDGGEWSVDGRCLPALAVGGDFFDYQVQDDVLHLALGDVMGKGTAAALIGAGARAALRGARAAAMAGVDLGVIATQVARGLLADLERVGSFVTLFEAVVDLSDGTLRYVDAGMGLCVLRHPDGNVEHLHSEDAPFGILGDDHWTERQATMEPGSRLLVFSDGVLDLLDDPENWRCEVGELLDGHDSVPEVVAAVARMARQRTPIDDVTVVAVHRRALADDQARLPRAST